MATGLRQRHGRGCKRKGGCKCPWEAAVYSKADGKKIRRTFLLHAEAKQWRADKQNAARTGHLRVPTAKTLREAGEAWLEGARAGTVQTRAGDPYKPSAIRSYEKELRLRIYPALGSRRLSEITRADLKRLVTSLVGEKLAPATVMVAMLPVRAIYREAIDNEEVDVNPTTGLKMPAVRSKRERRASAQECVDLLAALPRSADRAVWATAMYAGLRRGELQALRIEDIDLANGLIHVRRNWDHQEGEITPKSGKARKVPIAAALRDHLDEHLLSLDWREGLAFGVSAVSPFDPRRLTDRADRAWKAAKLERIILHECRHTYASMMIAAGVNPKALSTFMGHASIKITFDLYGHLLPGSEDEAAGLLDAYLARQLAPVSRQSRQDSAGFERTEAEQNPHREAKSGSLA